jgi:hypothetical protein
MSRCSRADKIAQRAAAIERVAELLAQKPRTALELSFILDVHQSTVFSYLHHMERELRTARKSGRFNGSRELWELGVDPLLPEKPEPRNLGTTPQRGTVPARQCGMWRDPLVAALFGPARSDINPTSRASASFNDQN